MAKDFDSIIKTLLKDKNTNNLLIKNLFTNNIEIAPIQPLLPKGGILRDIDVLNIKRYISSTHKIEISTQRINEIICLLADEKTYHPLKDYLNSLVWDEIPRLDKWISEICGVNNNEYYSEVGLKILCAAVYRAFNPGCKFDYMMILEGEQGIGKSTLLNILGGKWYLDTHFSTKENKQDIIDMMRTAWIVEISDLAGFNKSTIEHLKSFITRQVDRVRMPYARLAEDFPRQCVFIGTHNPSGDNTYFRDDTGNRRFWPVECKKIDLVKLREWRDQLWAEANSICWGQKLYLENPKSLEYLNHLHGNREHNNPLYEMIEDFVKHKNTVENKEILEKVFKMDMARARPEDLRGKCTLLGIWMRKNKWIKGENKKRGWYFRAGFENELIEVKQEHQVWEE